jgi:hypothetical protein
MSVREIQVELEKLSPEELSEVEKSIRVLRVTSAPGYRQKITEANRRMEAGQKVSSEAFEAKLGRDD